MFKIDLIPAWVKLLVVLAIGAGLWGHGFYRGGKDVKADWTAEKLATLEATNKRERELRDKNEAVSEQLQTALKNVRVEVVTVRDTVKTEVEKPVYKDCKVPATGTAVIQQNAARLNNLRKSDK